MAGSYHRTESHAPSLEVEHRRGQVALSGVGEDGHDDLALVFGALGQPARGRDGRTRRDAHQQAVVGCKLAPGFERLFVGDGDDFVVDRGVKRFGDESGANPLDLVRSGAAFGQDGGAGRFDRDNSDVGVLGFQERACARDGSAGSDTRYEDIYLAFGGFPDLGAGGGGMNGGVRGVDELAGDEGVLDFGMQFVGLGDRSLHALRSVGQHEFGPVGLHEVAALDRHGFGHGDDDAVPGCGGDSRKADSGVARGGLDEHGVVVDNPVGFGPIDHGLGDAILHRPGGVERFDLADDGRLQRVVRFEARKLHQRCVADEFGNVLVDGHGFLFLFPPERLVVRVSSYG